MSNTKKHEYLTKDNYYESHTVSKGRSVKTCEHCGKSIPIGMEHDVHKFYGDGEYPTYPTHIGCSKDFEDSLREEGDKDAELEIEEYLLDVYNEAGIESPKNQTDILLYMSDDITINAKGEVNKETLGAAFKRFIESKIKA